MDPTGCPETMVTNHQSTLRYIPEEVKTITTYFLYNIFILKNPSTSVKQQPCSVSELLHTSFVYYTKLKVPIHLYFEGTRFIWLSNKASFSLWLPQVLQQTTTLSHSLLLYNHKLIFLHGKQEFVFPKNFNIKASFVRTESCWSNKPSFSYDI